jgi:HSP20 family protein
MIRRTVLVSPTGARTRKVSGAAIPVSFWPQAPVPPLPSRWTQPAQPTMAPALPVDVFTTDEQAIIRAALPGVHPEQIEVSVHQNMVRIEAQLPASSAYQSDQVTWHISELGRGSLVRTIQLPFRIEEQGVEAQFANGMLQLILPRLETDKPHRVSVQVRPELTHELTAGEGGDEAFAAD